MCLSPCGIVCFILCLCVTSQGVSHTKSIVVSRGGDASLDHLVHTCCAGAPFCQRRAFSITHDVRPYR